VLENCVLAFKTSIAREYQSETGRVPAIYVSSAAEGAGVLI